MPKPEGKRINRLSGECWPQRGGGVKFAGVGSSITKVEPWCDRGAKLFSLLPAPRMRFFANSDFDFFFSNLSISESRQYHLFLCIMYKPSLLNSFLKVVCDDIYLIASAVRYGSWLTCESLNCCSPRVLDTPCLDLTSFISLSASAFDSPFG